MDSYIGTIQTFAFPFAPTGWAGCNGQIMPINQYQAVFALFGKSYGGDGVTNFALPNLGGRSPIGQGPGVGDTDRIYYPGENGGAEKITLTLENMPAHAHGLMATTSAATSATPGPGLVLAAANGSDPSTGDAITVNIYAPAPAVTALNAASIGLSGAGQPFGIRQPYLVVNYCIRLLGGPFPTRN